MPLARCQSPGRFHVCRACSRTGRLDSFVGRRAGAAILRNRLNLADVAQFEILFEPPLYEAFRTRVSGLPMQESEQAILEAPNRSPRLRFRQTCSAIFANCVRKSSVPGSRSDAVERAVSVSRGRGRLAIMFLDR